MSSSPIRLILSSMRPFLSTMGVTQLTYVAHWRNTRWAPFLVHHSLYMCLFVLPHGAAAVQQQATQVTAEEEAGGLFPTSNQTAADYTICRHLYPQNN